MKPRRRGAVLFVEGGGDHNAALKIECRRAFGKLIERAGLAGAMPRIVACGSRRSAYEHFTSACSEAAGPSPMLLVDSEAPVATTSPWAHVRERTGDGWARPGPASDDDLHLMVECMEAWIVADREALRRFYGAELREGALPKRSDVEGIAKRDLYRALEAATRGCRKGGYDKGAHSFKLLAEVDPARLRRSGPWAARFFAELERRR